MNRYLMISLAAATVLMAEPTTDLGEIQVESSTITDLEGNLTTEASTVNVIDEKTYRNLTPKNINEVLRTVPGITADVRSGDIVEIHMRGVAQQEFMWEDTGVAVVIDGVPVLQNGGKVKINLDNIESIKVIKGGASYLYGPNALAGAVIITTKKPKGTDSYSVSVDGGGYSYKNIAATFNRATENYMANLNFSYRYDGGYWDMTENWTGSGNGKFTYFIDETSDLTFGFEVTRKYEESSRGSVTGVTEAKENPTGADDGDLPWNHDYWSNIQKYFLTYNKDFADGGNLMVNGYYYKDNYKFQSSPQDLPTDGNYDGEDDDWTSDNVEDTIQYGLKSEYRNTWGDLGYMFGLDIGRRELDDSWVRIADYISRGDFYWTGESSTNDSVEDRLGLYHESKYALTDNLTTIFNIRYDHETYNTDLTNVDYDETSGRWTTTKVSHKKSFDNLSYRIGLTYRLNENHTFFSNVSTGFRNPRIYELYAADYDPDRYSQNNPDIDTETTINYEIGLRGSFNLLDTDIRYELSAYMLDTKDIIGRNGGTYYSNGNNVYFDNVGDARTKGVELSLHTDRTKPLAFSLSYTYMDAYYTSHDPFTVDLYPVYRPTGDKTYNIDGNQLPRTPHHRIDLLTYIKLTDRWTLITENYAQSDYYADETNFAKMPGYGIMNLQLRYENEIRGKKFEFYFKVDNLFDKQYYRTVYLFRDSKSGQYADGILDAEDASITVDPGRVIYAGMKYTF
jgi:iron complex outermembrane receptor protein